jgi:hypothetical protein
MNRTHRSWLSASTVADGPTSALVRSFCGAAALAAALATGLSAQEAASRGTIKDVDPDRGLITITADGKDLTFAVIEGTRIADEAGNPARGGLKHEGFKAGTPVMYRTAQRDGKTVLAGVKLGGQGIADFVRQPPPRVDMSGVKALSDMGPGETYKGFEGGLYPGGKKERPADHEAAGVALARQVRPLDRDGKPSDDGKVVLLTVGMSNTMQASSGFLRVTRGDTELNPSLLIVNGANGGMTANKIQFLDGGRTYPPNPKFVKYWEYVDDKLSEAGVTRAQVQAVWLKEADPGPNEGWPKYAQNLHGELARIMQLMHDRFPNLKLVYISNRVYGGWAKTRLNPEPYAYETGFAVKWVVEQQLKGDPELNFDPRRGPVRSPWLSWGPDLWANGTIRRSDGFSYVEDDLREDDRTHESVQGQDKVGRELVKFFKADPTSRGWFTRGSANP